MSLDVLLHMNTSEPHLMHIETRACNEKLQPYIEFYYFIRNDRPDFKSVHYSFPHLVNVVSVYQHAKYEASVGNVKISADADNNFVSLLQSKCQVPLRVELAGKTNRISIWFKNLGLNHFMSVPLGKILGNTVQQLAEWDTDSSYQATMKKCFATEDIDEKVALLEQWLLTKFKHSSFSYIEKASEMLRDIDQNFTVADVIRACGVPARTFNRHFKEMLGVSPIEFQRIARFRYSINHKLFNQELKKLTDIGYESQFYDQSDFIRTYRKLTGSNPKRFFKTVDRLADDKLIFKFEKK